MAFYKRVPDHAIPLSKTGIEQAREAGKHFAKFLALLPISSARLWYSPYLRAKQTRDGLLEGIGDKEVEWFENEPNPANCSIRWIGRDIYGRFEDKGYIFQGF